MTSPRAMTVPSFCRDYGISRAQFYIELREGRIKAVKMGNRNLIRQEDAEAWLNSLPERIAA